MAGCILSEQMAHFLEVNTALGNFTQDFPIAFFGFVPVDLRKNRDISPLGQGRWQRLLREVWWPGDLSRGDRWREVLLPGAGVQREVR